MAESDFFFFFFLSLTLTKAAVNKQASLNFVVDQD